MEVEAVESFGTEIGAFNKNLSTSEDPVCKPIVIGIEALQILIPQFIPPCYPLPSSADFQGYTTDL
jgi:hypothetical protein